MRAAAEDVGANVEDFKFHITLGRKNMPGVEIETIQNAIAKIEHTPSFSLPINKVEYRYHGRSHSTSLIKSWSLDE